MCNNGHNNWVSIIRDLLCHNGYGIVWLMGHVGNKDKFIKSFKQTLIDNFIQGFNAKMFADKNCEFYFSFKSIITTELYLRNVNFKSCLKNFIVLSSFD